TDADHFDAGEGFTLQVSFVRVHLFLLARNMPYLKRVCDFLTGLMHINFFDCESFLRDDLHLCKNSYGNKRLIQFLIASRFIFFSPRDLRRLLLPLVNETSWSCMAVAQRNKPMLVE